MKLAIQVLGMMLVFLQYINIQAELRTGATANTTEALCCNGYGYAGLNHLSWVVIEMMHGHGVLSEQDPLQAAKGKRNDLHVSIDYEFP